MHCCHFVLWTWRIFLSAWNMFWLWSNKRRVHPAFIGHHQGLRRLSKDENKQKLSSLDGTSCVACNVDDATKRPCLVSNSVNIVAGTDRDRCARLSLAFPEIVLSVYAACTSITATRRRYTWTRINTMSLGVLLRAYSYSKYWSGIRINQVYVYISWIFWGCAYRSIDECQNARMHAFNAV